MSLELSTDKAINLLTICRRAGRMVMGFDSVKDGINNGSVLTVIVAMDISPKTLKEAAFITEQDGIPLLYLHASMDDLWGALGKRVGIIGCTDKGFSKKLSAILIENNIKTED